MVIILEGPDCIGKTTICNKLINKYNFNCCHLDGKKENNLDYHMKLLNNKNMIFDRFNLGELIYSNIFNRICKFNFIEQIEFMNYISKQENIFYFILYTSDISLLYNRLFIRGDVKEVFENITSINNAYKLLANAFDNYKNIFAIDVSYTNSLDFIENIIEYNTEV